MSSTCRLPLSFGVFDHFDHAGRSMAQQFEDRLKIAEACDEAGFRSYHVAEHHSTPHGLVASPSLFLCAVAQRTRKLRVGPLVMLLNLYHPLRAFEEICMLDLLSGGRLDLGIGPGGSSPELAFFGVSTQESRERYHESAEIVFEAMKSQRLTHAGRHFTLRDIPITLSPVQKPHPPLWYGAMKPETAQWAAENSINIACVGTTTSIRPITDTYRANWRGPASAMPLLGMVRMVVIAETDAEAIASAGPAYARWLESFTFLSRQYDVPPPPGLPSSFAEALDKGFCITGPSNRIREELAKQAVEAGVSYVMCHLAFGDMPLAASLQTIARMRADIIPHIDCKDARAYQSEND
ncbi:LLM class flavin-dependent oxidoreductase [Bradyrhizobium sp. STM 3557]|uniref:LLM class flavin-dependent oxidoreductase n=1 Tax=Bradyrhizobium sp. STM 3557 TaxID=578920 RepID=UPI003890F232